MIKHIIESRCELVASYKDVKACFEDYKIRGRVIAKYDLSILITGFKILKIQMTYGIKALPV